MADGQECPSYTSAATGEALPINGRTRGSVLMLIPIRRYRVAANSSGMTGSLAGYAALASLCSGMGVECLELRRDADIAEVLSRAAAIAGGGAPVVIDVAIDYSEKTFFTKGVVKTTLGRLPLRDRVRFIGRAVGRRITGGGA